MTQSTIIASIATFLTLTFAGTAAQAASPSSPSGVIVNRGVVELETLGSAGISVRIAEDLADIIDDGATRRVVPVVGAGSLQNITDLKLLRGIDMAIAQIDALDFVRERGLFPGIENSVSYITRLYNEEFHLLVRREIGSITDLANRKVNVGPRAGGTAITAGRLFDLLKIPVTITTDNQEVALEKLRSGEIAAMAFVSGRPAPLLAGVTKNDGLNLLAIPFNSAVGAAYLPARLTSTDYPALISPDHPVNTVAVGSVLLAADLQQATERQRNVANFVDAFFTGFQALLTPGHHSKWQEVNLTADVPGWRRYGPADDWLKRNVQVAAAPSADELKSMFARFVDERRQANGGAPMRPDEKEDLFQQFQRWQTGSQH